MSDIQAEMFYLRKSMKDIERVMSKSYSLYETYRGEIELKEKTLEIAREVHEIKKDYYRVLKGFESCVKEIEGGDNMKLSNIFEVIKDNTNRYLKENDKNIKVIFQFKDDVVLKSYYSLFTILNNLIVNSIDACKSGDYIRIYHRNDDKSIYFEVSDTGEGIEDDTLPYIFNPGFTTKYDPVTGKPSTGIGLSHVKNIIEDIGGNIDVESRPGSGTVFKIIIPKEKLVRE
jgi:two-component system sensor histidine kinase YcbA